MSNYRSAIDESCLQHQNGIFPAAREATLNAIVNIAPGQNQRPISSMTDEICEELYKYGNSRLLNHTGRFASNPEYLFFMQYVIEQKKVADSISIALRKIQGEGMKAGSLTSGMQHLNNMIYSDTGFVFPEEIPK